jgi:hypothetical protein
VRGHNNPDPRNSKKDTPSVNYFFLSFACVNADAATLFSRLVEFGSRKIADALDATFDEVDSFFFAMIYLLSDLVDVLAENSLPNVLWSATPSWRLEIRNGPRRGVALYWLVGLRFHFFF